LSLSIAGMLAAGGLGFLAIAGALEIQPAATADAVPLRPASVSLAKTPSAGAAAPLDADAALLFVSGTRGPRADRIRPKTPGETISAESDHIMLAAGGTVGLPALHLASTALDGIIPPWASGLNESRPGNTGLDAAKSVIGEKEGKPVYFGGLTEAEFRTREKRCLATAIYFEARGESIDGQTAVAQTIMNRMRSAFYPDTICGVVYQGSERRNACQFSFACDRHPDIPKEKPEWETANEIARRVLAGEVWLESVGHASHYHATYVSPDWIPEMRRLTRIGTHVFYRARFLEKAGEDAGRAVE
jgi:hypothetical protein